MKMHYVPFGEKNEYHLALFNSGQTEFMYGSSGKKGENAKDDYVNFAAVVYFSGVFSSLRFQYLRTFDFKVILFIKKIKASCRR